MSALRDVIVIISLYFLFGLIHSFLASDKFKSGAAQKLQSKMAFYRLFYNIFALLTFIYLLSLSPEPDIVIYDLKYPFDLIMLPLQALSLIGFFWAARAIDVREFLGIKQIGRFFKGIYKTEEMDDSSALVITGPYKYSRHPLYFFSILFLALRPAMDLPYLVSFLCLTAYFYIGSLFEERKLISKFGESYLSYMKTVPRIFPFKRGRSGQLS